MKEIILQKSNFRCRENIYICRPLRRLRRLAVEYVKNSNTLNIEHSLLISTFIILRYGFKFRSTDLADKPLKLGFQVKFVNNPYIFQIRFQKGIIFFLSKYQFMGMFSAVSYHFIVNFLSKQILTFL